jgi:hypothetical protein
MIYFTADTKAKEEEGDEGLSGDESQKVSIFA